ncbi:MAG: sugar phosphate isomerase/epimerase, partial [Parasporobacterium sp.]|nr:sugar phosphate isomerase/epimerase [Parasporobacterium sp.]
MKISISNLGWNPALNNQVYAFLQARDAHIEVAPSIIMPWEENRTTAMFIGPYDRLGEASQWYRDIHSRYGLNVSSMQSVLYRITENIFGDKLEYIFLRNYMYKAVDFAAEIRCGNIVFGCPKNRVIPGSMDTDTAMGIARNFFKAVGDYAFKKGVFTGLEANVREDGTNFINTTAEAFEFVKSAGSEGLKVNVD